TPLGTVFYYSTPIGDERFIYPNMPSWNLLGATGWPGLPVDNRGFRVRGGGGGGGGPMQTNANGAASSAANAAPSSTPTVQNPSPTTQNPTPSGNVTDPDLSVRWIDPDRVLRSRQFVAEHFPDLKDAPLNETRACHYESTSSRDFIVDKHPDLPNVWIAGGGNAEGFKQGPVI